MSVSMFCIPGGHAGPDVEEIPRKKIEEPRGWRFVPASFENNEWVYV